MGQAQKSRQRNVWYKDVELELWELDKDDGGRSRANRRQPQRGLQVQEIRRYQTTGVGNRAGIRNACRGNERPVQSINRRRARKRKIYLTRAAMLSLIVLCLVMIYFMTGELNRLRYDRQNHSARANRDYNGAVEILSKKFSGAKVAPPEIIEDYLEVNDYSRPGTPVGKIKNIFVHYTANPGTTAAQNRSYFANLALTQERSASAHLIIGYDGELIQCIPFDEQAYAVMTRNEDSISIECCYISEDGSFTQETYDTLVHTLAWLIDEYDLSEEDILRHYDCGGKMCPVYYVEHKGEWEQLLRDVAAYKNSDEDDV